MNKEIHTTLQMEDVAIITALLVMHAGETRNTEDKERLLKLSNKLGYELYGYPRNYYVKASDGQKIVMTQW